MSAFTTLANGTVVRWHVPALDECSAPDCQRQHATKDQLFEVHDRERDHYYDEWKDKV